MDKNNLTTKAVPLSRDELAKFQGDLDKTMIGALMFYEDQETKNDCYFAYVLISSLLPETGGDLG